MTLTGILLRASALVMAILGAIGTFMPVEFLVLSEIDPLKPTVILFQIMGGMYLGFAVLNWMSRNAPIGGIYGKPLASANLIHFMVVGLMLGKEVFQNDLGNGLLVLSVLYAIFAIGFASTLFRDPLSGQKTTSGSAP